MQNTIKNILNASIASSVIAVVLGVLFLIFPVEALDVFRWIIAILAFATGGFIFVNELTKRKDAPHFGATAIAAIFVVIGIVFATRPAAINIFTIILGAWFIIMALSSLRFTAALSGSAAFCSVLMALISLIAGILLIVNPWGGSISIMIVLGASLLVFGATSAINTLVFKSNLKALSRKLGETAKEAKEAVVKETTKGTKKSK